MPLLKNRSPYNAIFYSYLALIVANLIWGAAGPIIKFTVGFIPPFTFLFYRFLLVCLVLLPYTLIELSKVKIAKQDYWKIIVLGLLSQSSLILIFVGLSYTTAVDASIISTAGVLMTMAVGHYLFSEKLHAGVKTGVVLALIGTVLVILEPIISSGHVSQTPVSLRIVGNLLILLYQVAFLLYIVWSKISMGHETKAIKKTLNFLNVNPMKHRYPPTLMSAITFYVGMFTILPFAYLESMGKLGNSGFNPLSVNSQAIWGLLYMAVFSSIVAYFLFEWALDKVGMGDAALLGYLSSIFGIPVAYLILGELPSKFGLIGAGIIFVGILIAEVSAHVVRKKKNWFSRS